MFFLTFQGLAPLAEFCRCSAARRWCLTNHISQAIYCGSFTFIPRQKSSRTQKIHKDFPNLFQENAVLGEETACLDANGVYNQKAPAGSRAPRSVPFSDPFFVTAAIAGGASMFVTSQNRNAVIQANSANVRGQVLAAAVVHQSAPAMRPYSGMRRTRHPIGRTPTFPKSKRWLIDARHLPERCGTELALRPQLWARLVLSKMARS
jgi:hypothetical protein